MEENVKVRFAKCLGLGQTANDLPKHISEFYDLMADRYQRFVSKRVPDYTLDPLIARLAELFNEQNEKIELLTDRVAALDMEVATQPTTKTSAAPIDWRTKEDRALKAQTQSVGAA